MRAMVCGAMLLSCCTLAHAGSAPGAGTAIAAAKARLVPALQKRIESTEVHYQMPREAGGKPPPWVDPCAASPETRGCKASYVSFRLQAESPAPGTCLREFVVVELGKEYEAFPLQDHGDPRVALGEDCTAIPSRGYARLDGIRVEEAANLLLWLRQQQVLADEYVKSGAAAAPPPAFIESCQTQVAFNRPGAGCDGGTMAAFARLPLAATTEINRSEFDASGQRRQQGEHWQMSVWPEPGQPGYRLDVHRGDGGTDRVAIRWELPPPF